mmetsp:Transcript_229/g.461  ORF Transcript_229/g.461 Transcript_229/m.461 type:complete len:278 (+) Transcript_229:595-1428(+)
MLHAFATSAPACAQKGGQYRKGRRTGGRSRERGQGGYRVTGVGTVVHTGRQRSLRRGRLVLEPRPEVRHWIRRHHPAELHQSFRHSFVHRRVQVLPNRGRCTENHALGFAVPDLENLKHAGGARGGQLALGVDADNKVAGFAHLVLQAPGQRFVNQITRRGRFVALHQCGEAPRELALASNLLVESHDDDWHGGRVLGQEAGSVAGNRLHDDHARRAVQTRLHRRRRHALRHAHRPCREVAHGEVHLIVVDRLLGLQADARHDRDRLKRVVATGGFA